MWIAFCETFGNQTFFHLQDRSNQVKKMVNSIKITALCLLKADGYSLESPTFSEHAATVYVSAHTDKRSNECKIRFSISSFRANLLLVLELEQLSISCIFLSLLKHNGRRRHGCNELH